MGRGLNVETFENQYMNRFWEDSPRDRRLRELAWEYLTLTEDYDWTICSVRLGKFAFVHGVKRSASARFAKECLNRAVDIMHSEGYVDVRQIDVCDKIQSVLPAFEAQYKPARPDWESIPDHSTYI